MLFPLMRFFTIMFFHLLMCMLGKTAFNESLIHNFFQGTKMHVRQGVGVV